VAELARGGLDVALEIGRIASAPGTAEQRAEALWEPLRRLVPFQAACLRLIDTVDNAPPRLMSVGYDEAFKRYVVSPDHTPEIELIGLHRSRQPMRVQDMPVPREEIRSYAEYLAPAGFREGLGVALFTPDGRYLGVLGLSTEDPKHPTEAARDLIGMLSPLIANAVDPLRSIAEAALMVRDAVAGVVLIRGGELMPLAGLPDHPMLVTGSAGLAAAERIARDLIYGSFLCPQEEPEGTEGYLRLTVLANRPEFPDQWAAVVLVSPPGDVRGLTRREMQIVGLLIEGWSNVRIATELFIAERTVATHVEHILAKFGAPSRTLAAARALRLGLYIPRPVTFAGQPATRG
jgi:DNA-binding CsgD family transcriptional regulator